MSLPCLSAQTPVRSCLFFSFSRPDPASATRMLYSWFTSTIYTIKRAYKREKGYEDWWIGLYLVMVVHGFGELETFHGASRRVDVRKVYLWCRWARVSG
jgi:hypothetical protein